MVTEDKPASTISSATSCPNPGFRKNCPTTFILSQVTYQCWRFRSRFLIFPATILLTYSLPSARPKHEIFAVTLSVPGLEGERNIQTRSAYSGITGVLEPAPVAKTTCFARICITVPCFLTLSVHSFVRSFQEPDSRFVDSQIF